MALLLTAGQAADSPQFIPVLSKVRVRLPVGRPRTRPIAVAGDKAYFSRANRAHLRKRRIKAVIPEKKDQAANRRKKGSRGGRPVTCNANLYRDRNTVERSKPQCCHTCGLVPSPSAPSSRASSFPVFVLAA